MGLERDYKIGAASRRCQTCGREFGVGDEYFSAVAETAEEDRLARQDFCPACWKADGPYFSFWRTRVPPPEEPSQRGPRLVDLGRLMQLFEHLADAADERAQRFRYVLALVLMRKRRLRVVESRRLAGGRGEELTLREVGAERRHVVSCPNISDDEIRSVADRLREILDMPDTWDQIPAGEADGGEAVASDADDDGGEPSPGPGGGAEKEGGEADA